MSQSLIDIVTAAPEFITKAIEWARAEWDRTPHIPWQQFASPMAIPGYFLIFRLAMMFLGVMFAAIGMVRAGFSLLRLIVRAVLTIAFFPVRPVLSMLFGAGSRKRRRAREPAAMAEPFAAEGARVIDGDTIAVQTEDGRIRVRLWGFDAPELRQEGGDASRKHLAGLSKGKKLQIVPVDLDVHGRIVARVRTETHDIGSRMVADGYAIADRRASPALGRLEDQARRSKSGLWKTTGIADPSAFRKQAVTA